MAYIDMWFFATQTGRTQAEADSMLEMAVRFADRTSERERLIILARDALYHGKLRDYRTICEELIQKYPTYAEIYVG